MATKLSRRKIILTLVELIDSGMKPSHVADLLAAYLVKTKQTRDVELYIRDLETAFSNRFGVTTVRVYSARKLGAQVKSQVKKLLRETIDTGNIELIEMVDPALIGGIVIKTADAELDRSIRTKLQILRSI